VRATSVLLYLALATSATAALLSAGGEEPRAQATALAAEGSFGFANSHDGAPIFAAAGIAPGESATGTVEIANTGTAAGELVLAQHDLSDVGGLGGGALSRQLSMRISDVTAPARSLTVYAGPLAPMPPQSLGRFEPGESRTYEFVATLPDGALSNGLNDVQGAAASVAYAWTAGEAGPSPESAPPTRRPSPGQPPSSAPPETAHLQLAITRIRHAIRRNRLLVWAGCDRPCAISLRGRLRARGNAGYRSVKLRSVGRQPRFAAGTQRLAIRAPRRLPLWLEANPGLVRLTARIVLLARDRTGNRARAWRAVRLRRPTLFTKGRFRKAQE